MRHFFSILAMVFSAVLLLVSIAGFQVNQLLREEEPIREMVGSLPQDDAFTFALSSTLVDQFTDSLPDQVSGIVPDGADSWLVDPLDSVIGNPEVQAAWDEVIQETRRSYDAQLLALFESGTNYDPAELRVEVDLSPLSEAITEPLREGLDSALGWIPGINMENFDWLAPNIEVDIDAVTEDGVDPYVWATGAALSQHWLPMMVAAGLLAVLGLLVGKGKLRWLWFALGAGIVAAGALLIGTMFGSLEFAFPPQTPILTEVVMEHVAPRYSEWMQPLWWITAGIAGIVAFVAAVIAVVAPPKTRR